MFEVLLLVFTAAIGYYLGNVFGKIQGFEEGWEAAENWKKDWSD